MKHLSGEKEKIALEFINIAAEIALGATCERSRCGSIIVKDNNIIGKGFNSPAKGQKRCSYPKDLYHPKVTDKTCCVHAEQRAIIDALKNNPDKIKESRLYFIRLDDEGKPARAGKPYCTICSKMALDVGIKEFVLWQEDGVNVYDTDEYNELSYQYKD